MTSDLRLTYDWFSPHNAWMSEILTGLVDIPKLRALEIGCFEGASTVWFLENILTAPDAEITVIDTFGGSFEHQILDLDFAKVKENFLWNIRDYAAKVHLICEESALALRRDVFAYPQFNLIYIDGSHIAKDVLEDAVLSFRALLPGGIMIFDDFGWNKFLDPCLCPHLAIECFLVVYARVIVLLDKSYRVAIRKL